MSGELVSATGSGLGCQHADSGRAGDQCKEDALADPSWAAGRPPAYLLFNSACHSSDVAATVGWVPIPGPGELLVAEALLHPHLWEALTPRSALHAGSCRLLRLCAPTPCLRGPALVLSLLLSPSQPPSWLSCHLPRSCGCRGASGPFPGLSCTGPWSTAPLGEDSSLTSSGSPDPMGPFAPCVPPAPLTCSPPPPVTGLGLYLLGAPL